MIAKSACRIAFLMCFAPLPAIAVEADIPDQLLTHNEVLPVLFRMHVDQLPKSDRQRDQADRKGVVAFYRSRQGKFLWVDDSGPTDRARDVFLEIARAADWGLRTSDFRLPNPGGSATAWSLSKQVDFEVKTSLAVLKYARYARGGRIDLSPLTKEIDRKPPLLSPWTVLAGIEQSNDPAAFLRGLHPQHPQFHLLRQAYLEARSQGTRRTDTQRLIYNMEMWRWMPEDLGRTHIWANIPEYKFRVVRHGQTAHEERMIVGKTKHKTPMFSDAMETIVINPHWIVPNSIKVKELLPSLLTGGSALRRQNLRIAYGKREISPRSVDWSKKDIRNYRVYQPPGGGNALGRIKFLFPNRHAVYMHDTPTKHLFKRRKRAFSHGCLRVRNPLKLAEALLKPEFGWDRREIKRLIRSGPEDNRVSLPEKVPVHVAYFTAMVTTSGKVRWFDDIYGHEKLIKAGLDGKAVALAGASGPQGKSLDEVRRQIIASRSSGSRSSQALEGGEEDYRSSLGAAANEPRPKPARRVVRRRGSSNWKRKILFGSD